MSTSWLKGRSDSWRAPCPPCAAVSSCERYARMSQWAARFGSTGESRVSNTALEGTRTRSRALSVRLRVIGLFVSGALNIGCSVALAAQGMPGTDFTFVTNGSDRSEVLDAFGDPKESERINASRTDIFELLRGSESSLGRALYYVAADMFSLGLHELLATPEERKRQEATFYLVVEYDENDTVTSAKRRPAPSVR